MKYPKRVADHLESHYEGLDASAYSAAVDDPAAIYWIFEYTDHAAFESIQLRLLEDEDYLELYQRAEGLFLDEETVETRIN